ncbi:D-alanyl-lipoteichoic acid biosynthesis protein DltD [Pediococcus acidilactici]|uniref:D-alanyl-lipoteichoic acid biosynthesis protein DltD n=1 Tax=Pediococcus acidilactici TaxID=1254 RepID=UPI002E140B36|nr:D-alanyl-lipoteichoic acid biosynthesis protein DltD [Pediococcus acidilactici]
MAKRLWMIFGPVLAAALILIGLLFSPFKINKINSAVEQKAATALSPDTLKGDAVKRAALENGNYVPFFGSSELSRFDLAHPYVMAEKYDWDFRPFLLGAPGTQSLTHYFEMQGINPQLKNKKAVFVISPQWFVRKGADPHAFAFYFSQLQAVNFLENQTGKPSERYAAKRLLTMLDDRSNSTNRQVINALNRVANGQQVTSGQRTYLKYYKRLLAHEDQLFSPLSLQGTNQDHINRQVEALPNSPSDGMIQQALTRQAKRQTSNNQFGIQNQFYNKRLKKRIAAFEGMQKHYDYTRSPEFADFQLILDQFAKNHTQVLFIIPPVNQKWADYVGLSQEMLRGFDKKINYQLQSQGFNQILDLSRDGGKKYFMQDTIHLGWYGWYVVDQNVKNFVDQPSQPTHYQIKHQFFDEDWQQLKPSDLKTYIKNN